MCAVAVQFKVTEAATADYSGSAGSWCFQHRCI